MYKLKFLLPILLALVLILIPDESFAQNKQKKQGMSALDHKDWLQKQNEFSGYKLSREEQKEWGVRYKFFGLSNQKRKTNPKSKSQNTTTYLHEKSNHPLPRNFVYLHSSDNDSEGTESPPPPIGRRPQRSN